MIHTREGIIIILIYPRSIKFTRVFRRFLAFYITPFHRFRIESQDRIEAGLKSKSRDLEPAAGYEAGARGSTNVFILYGCRSALESVSF